MATKCYDGSGVKGDASREIGRMGQCGGMVDEEENTLSRVTRSTRIVGPSLFRKQSALFSSWFEKWRVYTVHQKWRGDHLHWFVGEERHSHWREATSGKTSSSGEAKRGDKLRETSVSICTSRRDPATIYRYGANGGWLSSWLLGDGKRGLNWWRWSSGDNLA